MALSLTVLYAGAVIQVADGHTSSACARGRLAPERCSALLDSSEAFGPCDANELASGATSTEPRPSRLRSACVSRMALLATCTADSRPELP